MNLRHSRWALLAGLLICLMLAVHFARDRDEQTYSETNIAVGHAPAPATEPSTVAATAPNTSADTERAEIGAKTFRGRVVDAVTRQPVREFELRLLEQDSDSPALSSRDTRTVRTKDGRFTWRSDADAWQITVTSRGYQRFEMPGSSATSHDAELIVKTRGA